MPTGHFFRLRVWYFLVPLRAWPVASSIAIAREKSTSKNQAKGRRSWLLTRSLSCNPGTRRDVRRYSIDGARFLSAAAHRAPFSLLATCCFNFETDMSVFFIFLADSFLPSANKLFLVYGDASGRICQLPRGQEALLQRTSSARGRGCHVLRVALGDNEALNYTLRLWTPETWRSRRRPAPCLFHIIVENDQAELKAKKLETADSSSLHVRTWPTVPTHTRGLVLWQRRSSGSEATGTRVTAPCSWKVEVGIPDLRVKNFLQIKKPTARP